MYVRCIYAIQLNVHLVAGVEHVNVRNLYTGVRTVDH